MPESFTNITEGSGKKQHSFQRTIGANTVEDNVVIIGEPYLATYSISAASVSVATSGTHIIQLMAGASLNVYVRRIAIFQQGFTTAAAGIYAVSRVTTAGTGGTTVSSVPLDTTDVAPGATGMHSVATPGTLGTTTHQFTIPHLAAVGAGASIILDLDSPRSKPIRIPAGTSNGIVIRLLAAGGASNTVTAFIEFSEANF